MGYTQDNSVQSFQKAEAKGKAATKIRKKSEYYWHCGMHSNFNKNVSENQPAVMKGIVYVVWRALSCQSELRISRTTESHEPITARHWLLTH